MNAKKDFHAKFIKIKKKLLILSLSYALKKKKKVRCKLPKIY